MLEPTRGWAEFERACEKLRAAAENVARLLALHQQRQQHQQHQAEAPESPACPPDDFELQAAVRRATDRTEVVRARINALSDAHVRRLKRDARTSTQVRVRWEAARVESMLYEAMAPVKDLADAIAGAGCG